MEPVLDFRNTNALWGSVLTETLVRQGVRQAVVSPGSRSTALTMALARHPEIEAIPALDERSGAFFAVGLAKRSLRPVLLVCTSGTAAANYLPAVIEARESGTPLIVITADRPPELRDCASGQTIDQQKLFGGYVNFYHELAVPEADFALLRYLRQTVRHACERATTPAGPVHLNAPFRDPLAPEEDDTARALEELDWRAFFAPTDVGCSRAKAEISTPALERGLIVSGMANPADLAAWCGAAGEWARATGWPVLADALSPLRQNPPEGTEVVTAYDAILRDASTKKALRPDFVLLIEAWPTSKVLREWLAGLDVPTLVVTTSPLNRDALHGRAQVVHADLADTASAGRRYAAAPTAYATAWGEAERRVRARLDERLASEEIGFFEGKAAWLLARHLPEGTPLFVANSMPVRDLEYFQPATARGGRVYCNRGANGIDGTLSTALGIAHGGAPAVLLTGDLSFLHDANGLLLRPHFRGSLTVVLIDNNGGGIFEHLPVAKFDPPFEKFWATPQEVDFTRLCAAHGVELVEITAWSELVRRIEKPSATGLRVLRIRTDRKADAATRKALLNAGGRRSLVKGRRGREEAR